VLCKSKDSSMVEICEDRKTNDALATSQKSHHRIFAEHWPACLNSLLRSVAQEGISFAMALSLYIHLFLGGYHI
jgi:hypothetical protein